jgi:hypothetical protein
MKIDEPLALALCRAKLSGEHRHISKTTPESLVFLTQDKCRIQNQVWKF